MVSVSKLCCPTCWELFKALDLDIKMRGCHPTVTPLAIPGTLPPDIPEQIIKYFRPLLTGQLIHLLSDSDVTGKARIVHHYRSESETGHSASSSNQSHATDCSDSYRHYQAINSDAKVDAGTNA